jgi:hypothetical protein
MKHKIPPHLPVNVFAATHEMLKDWYLEPDSKGDDRQVLVVRQAKFDGDSAVVKTIRIPQEQWSGLIDSLQKILAGDEKASVYPSTSNPERTNDNANRQSDHA